MHNGFPQNSRKEFCGHSFLSGRSCQIARKSTKQSSSNSSHDFGAAICILWKSIAACQLSPLDPVSLSDTEGYQCCQRSIAALRNLSAAERGHPPRLPRNSRHRVGQCEGQMRPHLPSYHAMTRASQDLRHFGVTGIADPPIAGATGFAAQCSAVLNQRETVAIGQTHEKSRIEFLIALARTDQCAAREVGAHLSAVVQRLLTPSGKCAGASRARRCPDPCHRRQDAGGVGSEE